MTETIKQALELTPEESHALFNWSDDVFNAAGCTLSWGGGSNTHFVLETEGQPMCQLGALRHEVDVDGVTVKIAGLGGVITRPEAQGRGYARRLIQHALSVCAEEWSIEAGMLFCLDHMIPYYNSIGWQQLLVPVMIDQPQGPVPAPGGVFVRPLGDRKWPAGPVFVNRMPW